MEERQQPRSRLIAVPIRQRNSTQEENRARGAHGGQLLVHHEAHCNSENASQVRPAALKPTNNLPLRHPLHRQTGSSRLLTFQYKKPPQSLDDFEVCCDGDKENASQEHHKISRTAAGSLSTESLRPHAAKQRRQEVDTVFELDEVSMQSESTVTSAVRATFGEVQLSSTSRAAPTTVPTVARFDSGISASSAGDSGQPSATDVASSHTDDESVYSSAHDDSTLCAAALGEDEEDDGNGSDCVASSAYHSAHPTPHMGKASNSAQSLREKTESELKRYSVPRYVDDIWIYMRHRELHTKPRDEFLRKQSEVSVEMRTILVDWLVDAATEYGLEAETLHLAVSIVDRTLSVRDVPRLKLQLIGTTALWIASKYEEIYPPESREFVAVTDNTYTLQQMLRMERIILDALNFAVSVPTAQWFARRMEQIAAHPDSVPSQLHHTVDYLLELALVDYSFSCVRRSQLAAAAICLASEMCGKAPYSVTLERESGVPISDLTHTVKLLLARARSAPHSTFKAVYNKFTDIKRDAVALIPLPADMPYLLP